MSIPLHRLDAQLLLRRRCSTPAEVVAWFGAVQAQDYLAMLWAVGLRTPGATQATVEAALADGSLIRTHLFRGTWQLVAREDARWMLDLMGAKIIASWASRLRQLELDDRTLGRCRELFTRALADDGSLTRKEMAAVLARGRIAAVTNRLAHILGYAELCGVIHVNGRRDKQPTWALLGDREPGVRRLSRDAALAELARRYFRSRGPATLSDFSWWTGLSMGGAREALELAGAELESRVVAGATYWSAPGARSRRASGARLLPAFDEYLVGYRDRSAMVDPAHARKVNAGGGMLSPTVVIDGRVVGTWQRKVVKDAVTIEVRPFARLTRPARDALAATAARYGAFLGAEVTPVQSRS